ncbi:TetR/AcrR family transcriptional regulator [Streptomyces fagopyri]|nr:TetR/AcrR family transcriptional regulator [Streptomyces fagopyri]
MVLDAFARAIGAAFLWLAPSVLVGTALALLLKPTQDPSRAGQAPSHAGKHAGRLRTTAIGAADHLGQTPSEHAPHRMLTLMSAAHPARKRDSAATREAILAAAVVEFTEHGYAAAGVRQISERAGVTAMMINRYFGSKKNLFAHAVDRAFSPSTIVGGLPADLPSTIAGALAERTAPGAEQLDPFLLLLRSAAEPEAADILRQGIEAHVGARFSALLDGSAPDVRAQLGLALVAGTWLLRTVVGTTALATADNDSLAALLTEMLEPVVHRTAAVAPHDNAASDTKHG